MHQTTLRFPEDLWRFLEGEAKSLGVEVLTEDEFLAMLEV